MKLNRFIDHYYGGNQRLFYEAVGVSQKTAYRWVSGGAVVFNGKICLPTRELPELPCVPPDSQREAFEKRVHRMYPNADISSVNGTYLDKRVQGMWEGWCLAQTEFTREALGII